METGDVQHAVANAFVVADMGDDESPPRTLVLGLDRSGNMLEAIVLHFDDGRELVIHAMPMRAPIAGCSPAHWRPDHDEQEDQLRRRHLAR